MPDQIYFIGRDDQGVIYALTGVATHPIAIRGRLGRNYEPAAMVNWGYELPGTRRHAEKQPYIEIEGKGIILLDLLGIESYELKNGKICQLQPGSYQLALKDLTDFLSERGVVSPARTAEQALERLRRTGMQIPADPNR